MRESRRIISPPVNGHWPTGCACRDDWRERLEWLTECQEQTDKAYEEEMLGNSQRKGP